MPPLLGVLNQSSRRSHLIRIAKHRRPGQIVRHAVGLGFQAPQPFHVGHKRAQDRLRIGGQIGFEERLQPLGPESFTLPPEDCLGHPAAPRLELSGDRGRHITEELSELVGFRLPTPTRRLLSAVVIRADRHLDAQFPQQPSRAIN